MWLSRLLSPNELRDDILGILRCYQGVKSSHDEEVQVPSSFKNARVMRLTTPKAVSWRFNLLGSQFSAFPRNSLPRGHPVGTEFTPERRAKVENSRDMDPAVCRVVGGSMMNLVMNLALILPRYSHQLQAPSMRKSKARIRPPRIS